MITLEYKGKQLVNFTKKELKDSGVPDEIINQAMIEEKWSQIKVKREKLLFSTDYTQFDDSPLTIEKKADFAIYRQALRDLPQNYSNADDIDWPQMPQI